VTKAGRGPSRRFCRVEPLAAVTTSGAMAPVRLALLGAGIFAQDAVRPVLQKLRGQLLPRFVWSRSQGAAEKLGARLREWAEDVEAVWGGEGLRRIEQAREVPCCAVVLPIQAQVRPPCGLSPPPPQSLVPTMCYGPFWGMSPPCVQHCCSASRCLLGCAGSYGEAVAGCGKARAAG